MPALRNYAEPILPVSQNESGGSVYERFQAEPRTLVIAVVDDDGVPIGLVERNDFGLKMGGAYGRALYAGRPISLMMDPDPLIVDAEDNSDEFFSRIFRENASTLFLKGFVVVEDGRYAGVASTLSLLHTGYNISRLRAEEMERLAADLAKAEADARAAVRAKSQFLAVMSHEVRTPLNGVLAVAEIIDGKLQQEDLRLYVRTIMQSGQTLLRLLTDVLDVSRAEANGLSLIAEPFSICRLLKDVDLLWRPRAEPKGLRFQVEARATQDVWVSGDAVRLKQVLNNLVGNALKFTDMGSVRVEVDLDRTADTTRLAVAVVDTGPGIAPDRLDAVFEPFSRQSAVHPAGGAGLGLSICREILRGMGGSVELTSEVGAGSVFRLEVTLPNASPQAAAPALAPLEALPSGGHVLVVDDNETNRLVACTLLQSAGCTCITAVNGAEAVEMTRTGDFDVILMDIKMPVLGGVEATRQIRALPGPKASIPIIALTANADLRDADLYLAEGMNAVVQKPLEARKLLAALADALAGPDDALGAELAA